MLRPRITSGLVSVICMTLLVLLGLGFRKWLEDPGNSNPASSTFSEINQAHTLFRKTPVVVRPCNQEIFTELPSTLELNLYEAHPYWKPYRISCALHLLRIWGPKAEFPDREGYTKPISGSELLTGLLDNDVNLKLQKGLDHKFEKLLARTEYGIRVTTNGDTVQPSILGVGHVDQLIAILGECGLSLDTPVNVSNTDQGTISDLLSDSAALFCLEQELEWTTIAYALWLPPHKTWTNRFGETFSFDDLATTLMSKQIGKGSCYGIHTCYALALISHVDQQRPIISVGVRNQLKEYLLNCTLLLSHNELNSGGWDKSWSSGKGYVSPSKLWSKRLERIMCIGHHLEWLALLPEKYQSRPLIRRAILALKNELYTLEESERHDFHTLLPLSHAANALLLFSHKRFASSEQTHIFNQHKRNNFK